MKLKFCKTNFGITFPLAEKTNVIGNNSHPFYKWAKRILNKQYQMEFS